MNKKHLNTFHDGMSILDEHAENQSNYTFGLNGRIYSYKKKLAFTSIKGNRLIVASQEFIDTTKEIVGSYSFGDLVCLITISNDPAIDNIWTLQEDGIGGFNFELKASADLNLQDGVKLVCRGVKENQLIQSVYWTDGLNPLRKANLLDPDLSTFVEEQFNVFQNVFLEEPVVVEVDSLGTILPMNAEYVYRLVNAAGVQTDMSLPSSMISILKTYGQASGEGNLPGVATSTSVRISISNIDTTLFERIEVYVKEYEIENVVTDIKTLYDGEITGSTMFFNHTGAPTEISSGLDSALITVKALSFDTAEYIETKDNRLFAANLKVRDLASAELPEDYLLCRSYDNAGQTYPGKFNPDHSVYKYTKDINGNLVRGAESDFFADGSGIRLTFVTQQELLDKRNPDNGYSAGVTYLDTITSLKGNRSYQRDEIYRMMYSLKVKDSVQYSYAEFCCDLKIPSNKEPKLAGDYNHPSGLHQYTPEESLLNTFATSFVKKDADNSPDFKHYGQAIYIKVEYRDELDVMKFYSDLNILRAIRTDADKTILDQGIVHPFSRTLQNNYPVVTPDDYDFEQYENSNVGLEVMPGATFKRIGVIFVPPIGPILPTFISSGVFTEGPYPFQYEPGVATDSNIYYLTSNTASASQYLGPDQLVDIGFQGNAGGVPDYDLTPIYGNVRIGFRPDMLSFDSPLTVLNKHTYDLFENFKLKVVKRGNRNTYNSQILNFNFNGLGTMPYIRNKFDFTPIMYNASNDINIYNGDWFDISDKEVLIDNAIFVEENQQVDDGIIGTGAFVNNNPLPISLINDYDQDQGTTDTSIEVTPTRSAAGINTFAIKTKAGNSLVPSDFNERDPGGNPTPPFPNNIPTGDGSTVFGLRRGTATNLGPNIASYRANIIVNVVRELISQYGGNTESALISRGYINCLSIDIDGKQGVSDVVKNGDIYIDVFEYAKHNLSKYRERYDGEPYGDSHEDYQFNQSNNGYLSSIAMVIETPVPLDFSNGTTVERTDLHPYNSMGYEYNDAYFSESDLLYFTESDKQLDLGNNIERCSTIASSEIKINGEFIDSWTKFLINNFYELDIDRGCIFNLIKLNNEIHTLQSKNGLARLYINSRQLIQDNDAANVLIKNNLGDGGPIETHVYISKFGSAIKDSFVIARDYFIYFSEIHKKIVLSNGTSAKVLSEELGVQREIYEDIVSGKILDVAGYFDELNSEVVLSIITDNLSYSFSYSDLYRKANGFYSHTSTMHIVYNEFIMSKNNLNELWEYNEGIYLSFYGRTENFELEFIVNSEYFDTKIFDNFRSDILSISKASEIRFETNLVPEQIILENDSRYRVRENVHVFPYREETGKQRMRGSYLKVKIIFINKNELISIFNVVSIYRKSFK